MTTQTETYQLETDLTLRDSSQSTLSISAKTLTLTQQNNTLIESRLTFQIPPSLYQDIDTKALFNLKPELRSTLTGGEFLPSANIEIIATLKPDFLLHFIPHINDGPTYLKNLSQSQPNHPLLSTENWLALQVKQEQTGYQTFWNYLTPSAINPDHIDQEKINEAICNFFQDWAAANLSTMEQEAIERALTEVTKGFEEWAETNISLVTSSIFPPIIEEMIQGFGELANARFLPDTERDYLPIFEAIINFFTSYNWTFSKLAEASILQLRFQGENGEWECYAKAREEENQFVFYSICPVKVPKPKRRAVGEFIARANYGTISGNFELDFADGEIRYKTSIDLEDNRLPPTLINRLVYTNVSMMDEYLPGIISVINGDESPSEAILLIEKIELSPPPSDPTSSNNLTDNQPPATPRQKKKAKSQPSPPPEPNLVTASDILCRLTTEEILKFEQLIPLQKNWEKPIANSIIEQLKTGLKTRLGEEGEKIFEEAYKLFLTSQFDAKQVRFIRRYIELYVRGERQIEELNQQGSEEENLRLSIEICLKMRDRAKMSVQQIADYPIYGRQEVDMLVEIENIKGELARAKNNIVRVC